MAQLTIYIDEGTRKKIEAAAREADTSVSQWVKSRIQKALETEWPEGYFELFGSLADSNLERPEQLPSDADASREPL